MNHNSRSHHQHPLGINKLGKSIRKSPLHHPNFQKHPPPQPQVYNISKSDFRTIVQQLTGSPARDPSPSVNIPVQARPPQPKPPSSRLMKIRPPPLPLRNSAPNLNPNPNPNPNPIWTDSPVSAYMRYLESSLLSSDSSRRAPAQGLLPVAAAFTSPRGNAPPSVSSGPVPMLPSPGSQFPLPSPSLFLNLLSPKSPYPLLSPGFQYPQSFAPDFSFSPMPRSGILGPGPGSQPPPSPSLLFPPSPSGFLPLLSPRWREM